MESLDERKPLYERSCDRQTYDDQGLTCWECCPWFDRNHRNSWRLHSELVQCQISKTSMCAPSRLWQISHRKQSLCSSCMLLHALHWAWLDFQACGLTFYPCWLLGFIGGTDSKCWGWSQPLHSQQARTLSKRRWCTYRAYRSSRVNSFWTFSSLHTISWVYGQLFYYLQVHHGYQSWWIWDQIDSRDL